MGEFQLIEWIRHRVCEDDSGLIIGIGDDAAVLSLPENRELVISTDTLNSGVHFLKETSPGDLGHKSLAVSLSDLAAMGATPCWALLSISIPRGDKLWLEKFIGGFLDLAGECGITLIGGDTCSGSLSITVTAMGLIDPGKALTRDGARPGDLVVVSGCLGGAAMALSALKSGNESSESCSMALHHPVPRIALGSSLVGKATSCIDISDGLLADLGHIVNASACGAVIEVASLPANAGLNECEQVHRWTMLLSGGEDYELCFSIAADQMHTLEILKQELGLELTVIGRMVEGSGVRCIKPDGDLFETDCTGYEHFK